MTTYYLKLDLSPDQERMVERYNQLAPDYENLSAYECHEFDDITAELFQPTQLVLWKDTTVITWYPVNGFVKPEPGKTYLLTDGKWIEAIQYGWDNDGWGITDFLNDDRLTYFAPMPTLPTLPK